MQLTQQQKQLITDLAQDLSETVKKIESEIPTTQNQYGRYGALINTLSKGNKKVANVIALALIEAGANQTGVVNGLRLFT